MQLEPFMDQLEARAGDPMAPTPMINRAMGSRILRMIVIGFSFTPKLPSLTLKNL
jgi:hypothetical protein